MTQRLAILSNDVDDAASVVLPVAGADLGVTKVVDVATPDLGSNIVFTVTLTLDKCEAPVVQAEPETGELPHYGLRGLEVDFPGFEEKLKQADAEGEAVVQETLLRLWQVAPRHTPDGRPDSLLRLGIREHVEAGTFHSVMLGVLKQRWADTERRPRTVVNDRRRLVGPAGRGPTVGQSV